MTFEKSRASHPEADAAAARDLWRVKLLATLSLVACLAIFIVAKLFAHVHPVVGFVGAFAEAATVGGLADWYAVVALFRHPLGLPIPHTAIIQNNQDRMADKLGQFIEEHFLDAAPIEAKLRQIDFASFMAAWMNDRKRGADLARFVLRLLPEAVSATETSGLVKYATRRVMAQLQSVNLAPVATETLRAFVREGRHRELLDDLLAAIHGALTQQETMTAFRAKVRDELPTLLKWYRADAFLVKRIMASATAFFDEVRADPNHPFRDEFDRMVLSFVDRIGNDPAYVQRLDDLKSDLLARPELASLARGIWSSAKAFIERSASGDSSVLQHHLTNVFIEAGRVLASDDEIRAEINNGVVMVLCKFIAEQKSGVSTFIADQMKTWDMKQLISVIEMNVGKDLQYIRFNGMLIGGLVGLALHAIEVLL